MKSYVNYDFGIDHVIKNYQPNLLDLAKLFDDYTKHHLVFAEDANKLYFNDGARWQLDFSNT